MKEITGDHMQNETTSFRSLRISFIEVRAKSLRRKAGEAGNGNKTLGGHTIPLRNRSSRNAKMAGEISE